MEQSYSRMCGPQWKTFQVNSFSLSSQRESNLLQTLLFHIWKCKYCTLMQSQNPNTIKATGESACFYFAKQSYWAPLVTASWSDSRFTSTHPHFLVRGKSSSFAGELTSTSKRWAACESRGWWECQPMKRGGEWDESGATGRAAACYYPLRCVLIPRSFPSVAEPGDRSATVGCGVWESPGRPGGRRVQLVGSCQE